MQNQQSWIRFGFISASLGAAIMLLAGCASPAAPASGAAAQPAPTAWWKKDMAGKTGAELWAVDCQRCHNIRSPGSFNDAQWDIAVMHMRERANLTGDEERKILQFLKSAD